MARPEDEGLGTCVRNDGVHSGSTRFLSLPDRRPRSPRERSEVRPSQSTLGRRSEQGEKEDTPPLQGLFPQRREYRPTPTPAHRRWPPLPLTSSTRTGALKTTDECSTKLGGLLHSFGDNRGKVTIPVTLNLTDPLDGSQRVAVGAGVGPVFPTKLLEESRPLRECDKRMTNITKVGTQV